MRSLFYDEFFAIRFVLSKESYYTGIYIESKSHIINI